MPREDTTSPRVIVQTVNDGAFDEPVLTITERGTSAVFTQAVSTLLEGALSVDGNCGLPATKLKKSKLFLVESLNGFVPTDSTSDTVIRRDWTNLSFCITELPL